MLKTAKHLINISTFLSLSVAVKSLQIQIFYLAQRFVTSTTIFVDLQPIDDVILLFM